MRRSRSRASRSRHATTRATLPRCSVWSQPARELVPFPKDVMEAAFTESLKLCSEIGVRNPNWKRIYDDYAKFRREQHLWLRFAEYEFDGFMQQHQSRL